jgi:PKHD-type hydroxylase
MFFYFHPAPLPAYCDFTYYRDIFSKEECEKIKRMFGKTPGEALTGHNEDCLLTNIPSDIRKTEVDWICYSQETDWLYKKLTEVVFACNAARYRFDLSGFLEKLQLTHYREGDYYGWHQDNGAGDFGLRKLSIVVQLSEPSDYEGGDLEFLTAGCCTERGQGTVILFPSYNAHQVTPVTKGERWSLVAWVRGPAYR